MTYIDPRGAPDEVREAFEYQAVNHHGVAPGNLDQAYSVAALWESLRGEADEEPEPVGVVQLTEDSQVRLYDLVDEVSRSMIAFVRGYFGIQHGDATEVGQMFDDLGVDGVRHGRALIGARVAFAIIRSIEVDSFGLASIDPVKLGVQLVEGGIEVKDTATPEEHRTARVRWMLSRIEDARRRPSEGAVKLYEDEVAYAEQLRARLDAGAMADEQEYADVQYVFVKIQPHEELFQNAKGRERLFAKQRERAIAWAKQAVTGDLSRVEHHERQFLDQLVARVVAGEDPLLVLPDAAVSTVFRIQARVVA